jgi:hypothetical protein
MAPRSTACALAFLLASPALTPAQHAVPAGPPAAANGTGTTPGNVVHRIDGEVRDLARDAAGRILYCTLQGEVGRIVPGGAKTVLVGDASANPVSALAETPEGDVAVLDGQGHVRVLSGGAGPAVLVFSDPRNMIQDASDLIVDARGNFLIASATPSSGVRAMNIVSEDGARWGYYLVRHAPLQLAHDALTGGIVISDSNGGGNLQLVVAGSVYRPTTPLDTTTHPGPSSAQSDGDVALEEDGDVYWIAGGEVWKRTRATGTTSLYRSGFGQLRGAVIAQSSGHLASPSGWSLYLAEGANPTRIRELPGVGAPGALIANDQGWVHGRGSPVDVSFGFQVFELATEDDGDLLVGGGLFSSSYFIKRITLGSPPSIATIATGANGLAGIVEGLAVAPDDSLYALTRPGVIQRITEGPLSVTTVFSDPAGQITDGKDLALDLDGTLYVGTRESWGFGKLMRVSGGTATLLTFTEETRGLAAAPGGGLFLSQWNDMAFAGTVERWDFEAGALESQPGFAGMNYTNDSVWGDGDLCVDANGSIYTISEDDWSLVRYDPWADAFERVGSGYVNHPSGLAIAPSTPGSGSTTGWSLYVAEFDYLWEKPGVAAPASTLVDSTLGLVAAGSVPPRYGRPRAIAAAPQERLWVSTALGWVLELDPATGALEELFGPCQGLRGDLALLALEPLGERARAANLEGDLFRLDARTGSVQQLASGDPRVRALALERLAEPRLQARQSLPGVDSPQLFWLQGQFVRRVPME